MVEITSFFPTYYILYLLYNNVYLPEGLEMRCWAWPCMRGILATTCKPPSSSDNKTGPSSESSRTMATMARYVHCTVQYSSSQCIHCTVVHSYTEGPCVPCVQKLSPSNHAVSTHKEGKKSPCLRRQRRKEEGTRSTFKKKAHWALFSSLLYLQIF